MSGACEYATKVDYNRKLDIQSVQISCLAGNPPNDKYIHKTY